MSDKEKSEFITEQILPGEQYKFAPIQYWLYYFWDTFSTEDITAISQHLHHNLELLTKSSKMTGILLFSKYFDSSSLKEQQKILKANLKEKNNLLGLITQNANIVYFFVKVFVTFDDSVTLKNCVLNHMSENILECLDNKDALSLMLFVVNGDFEREFFAQANKRCISANMKEFLIKNNGKKPFDLKLSEVRKFVLNDAALITCFTNDFKKRCFENAQFCVFIGLVIKALIVDGDYENFVNQFVNILVEDTKQVLSGDEEDDAFVTKIDKEAFIANPYAHRLVKKFIQSFIAGSDETKINLEESIQGFVDLLIKNLKHLIKTRAVFVFIALIENTFYDKIIKKALKKFKGFNEMVAKSENKGIKILHELVYPQ